MNIEAFWLYGFFLYEIGKTMKDGYHIAGNIYPSSWFAVTELRKSFLKKNIECGEFGGEHMVGITFAAHIGSVNRIPVIGEEKEVLLSALKDFGINEVLEPQFHFLVEVNT